jgi:type I restriction-modification system DNA methylase subunit
MIVLWNTIYIEAALAHLPKDYNRPALNKVMLGELIDLASGIAMHEQGSKARDILGRIGDIAIYGQESNYTTWRLAKMNLAVRGIDADIRWNNDARS